MSGETVPPPPEGFVPSSRGPYTTHNGPMFHRRNDDGGLTHAFFVLPRHCNSMGIVHGGMLSTFFDGVVAGAVGRVTGGMSVTVHLSLDFLSMARAGEWVYGEGRVTRQARDLARQGEKPDIIVASLPDHVTAAAAVAFGRQIGAAVIVDVRDKWPDILFDLTRGSPLKQMAGRAAMLVENARTRSEEQRLAHELHEARAALDRAYLRPSYRVREKLLRGVRRTAVGRGLHRVYRLARGRRSRPA